MSLSRSQFGKYRVSSNDDVQTYPRILRAIFFLRVFYTLLWSNLVQVEFSSLAIVELGLNHEENNQKKVFLNPDDMLYPWFSVALSEKNMLIAMVCFIVSPAMIIEASQVHDFPTGLVGAGGVNGLVY